MTKLDAVIFDMDGTLADFQGLRSPYDAARSENDRLIEPVGRVLRMCYASDDLKIIICSGRQEKDREPTVRFLKKHHLPYHELFMRETNDRRKDVVIKKEIYFRDIEPTYNVVFVVDDRLSVIEMWVSLGLFVFNVNQSGEDY